jgi:hypothetical protein
MPESHSFRVTPRRTRSIHRRLMIAASLVIVTLVVAIGLVGAMTVATLASR